MKRKTIIIVLFLIKSLVGFSQKIDESRFTKVILDNDLNEPMELAIADDGVIFYIERVGHLNKFDVKSNKKTRITTLKVRATSEDGLMGLALDPNFTNNRWLYLYYGDPLPINNQYANVLARFELTENGIINKKELLRIPLLHEGVSHSGGSLCFDNKGNLYLSTGDNTSPFESEGYSPTDDREGRLRFDALKSSGNTNDLRGKIIRIHPEEDGTYTIPEGNLFPKGLTNTRPEIYVMGCRNPYRIAVDNRTQFLYWGEVGPDAGKDSPNRGPRGHDEINQARKAGNFGWPLFVGNNKAYYRYDFENKKSGELFDAQKPVNFSRNNTGLKTLPAAQNAFIWYPYAESPEFPELGTGGRNAMAGPVYYYADYKNAIGKFPAYFDKKLFIYDWMRGWIFNVSMKENGDFEKLERFLPNEEFNHPIDMAFNRNGELYILEYGSYWRAKNLDAKLVKIEYNEGNRTPVARISANKMAGAAPMRVEFSAKGSMDYDKKDSLTYQWFFTSSKKVQAQGINASFTFTKNGIYPCKVRVIDNQGRFSENTLTIRVGNAPPTVKLNWSKNRSFYFSETIVAYSTKVTDKEDKPIDNKRIKVLFNYLPEGEDVAGLMANGDLIPKGKTLIEASDCMACHAFDKKSIGPSYKDIAKRYNESAVGVLTEKIINGGSGVWSKDHMMSAHPQLLKEDVEEMVHYILSLSKPKPQVAPKGTVKLKENKGNYILVARYIDKGGLMAQDMLRLRPPRVPASDADVFQGVAKKNLQSQSLMSYNEDGAWICFKNIDLTDIKSIEANLFSPKLIGQLEVRIDSPKGVQIAAFSVDGVGQEQKKSNIIQQEGLHDVYFKYKESSGGIDIWKRLDLKWLEFKN